MPAEQIIDPLKSISNSKIAVVAWREVVEIRYGLGAEVGGRLEFARDFCQNLPDQLVVDGGRMQESAPRCHQRGFRQNQQSHKSLAVRRSASAMRK